MARTRNTKTTPKDVISAAMRDYKKGDRIVAIAERYGKSPATITSWAKKKGYKLRQTGRKEATEPSPTHLAILLRIANTVTNHVNVPYKAIGQEFGALSKQRVGQIYSHWKKRGWKPDGAKFKEGDEFIWRGATYKVVDPSKGIVKEKRSGQTSVLDLTFSSQELAA
jgi:transposase